MADHFREPQLLRYLFQYSKSQGGLPYEPEDSQYGEPGFTGGP